MILVGVKRTQLCQTNSLKPRGTTVRLFLYLFFLGCILFCIYVYTNA